MRRFPFDAIVSRLTDRAIPFVIMTHEAVDTSVAAAKARGTPLNSGAKALLVKAGPDFVLIVIPGDRTLEWKAVRHALAERRVRLATSDELRDNTGLPKGAVPPFGKLLGLRVFVDSELARIPLVRFNAGDLTRSIEMPGHALVSAVEGTEGHFTSAPRPEETTDRGEARR